MRIELDLSRGALTLDTLCDWHMIERTGMGL